MPKTNPCTVCGEPTSKFLFKDRKLNIAMCSGECEHEYIQTLSRKDEDKILNYLDRKIERTKLHKKIGWTVAGCSLLLVLAGFLVKSVEMFMIGFFPMTVGAFSTRHFEDRLTKLTRTRKRVAI